MPSDPPSIPLYVQNALHQIRTHPSTLSFLTQTSSKLLEPKSDMNDDYVAIVQAYLSLRLAARKNRPLRQVLTDTYDTLTVRKFFILAGYAVFGVFLVVFQVMIPVSNVYNAVFNGRISMEKVFCWEGMGMGACRAACLANTVLVMASSLVFFMSMPGSWARRKVKECLWPEEEEAKIEGVELEMFIGVIHEEVRKVLEEKGEARKCCGSMAGDCINGKHVGGAGGDLQ